MNNVQGYGQLRCGICQIFDKIVQTATIGDHFVGISWGEKRRSLGLVIIMSIFHCFMKVTNWPACCFLSRQIHLLTINEEKTCAWHHASTEGKMSKKSVEELLIAGGADEKVRNKYNELKTKEEFVTLAKADGYEFSIQELDSVLRESGDDFESFGNPPKRMIWWH